MQCKEVEKENFYLLDVMKIVCAILILCGHFISENYELPTKIDYIFSLDIIGVPFFFACSGFLLFYKCISLGYEKSLEKLKRWVKRLVILYMVWTLVYLAFDIIYWMQQENAGDYVVNYVHEALVYSTGPTIWFLPAMIIGGVIVWYLYYKIGIGKTILVTMALYVIGSIMYTYVYIIPQGICRNVYDLYQRIFLTSRNGVFNAPVFMATGAYIAVKKIKKPNENGFWMKSFVAVLLFLCVIGEAFIAKRIDSDAKIEFVIMLVPCTYFVISALVSVKVKFHKLYITFRKLSTEIFVSQRLILTAIPMIWPGFFAKFLPGYWYIDLVIVIAIVVFISEIIIWLGRRYKVLSWFS